MIIPLKFWRGMAFTRERVILAKGRQGAGGNSASGQYANRPVYSARPERNPAIRSQWEHNKKIILTTQSICGICGLPVDKSLKFPDPMSATVDHIIPVSKRGDPVALENLQLAHRICNRAKSDKLPENNESKTKDGKLELPQSANWRTD